jgi:hypothetical protein
VDDDNSRGHGNCPHAVSVCYAVEEEKMSYIKREDAIIAVTRAKLPDVTENGVPIANGKRSVTDCVRRIKEIPSADVAPVRHGKWSETYNGDHAPILFTYTCSACKGESFNESNYCPNCGADMREEQT